MVTRYKDTRRIRTADKPKVNYNISIDTTGQESIAKSLIQASQTVSNVFFRQAQDNAVRQAEQDASVAEIPIKDGVPYINKMEAGGSIYNDAYNKAAKVTYLNTLENSVEKKITDITTDFYSNPSNRSNTELLAGNLNSVLEPMRENIPKEFQSTFDIIVGNKVNPLLKSEAKENANRARTKLLNGLGQRQNKIIDRIKTLKDGPENEALTKELADVILSQNKIDPDLISKSEIEDIWKELAGYKEYNKFRSVLFETNENGDFKITQEQLRKIQNIFNGNEDLQVKLPNGSIFNNEEAKKLFFTNANKQHINQEINTFRNRRSTDDTAIVEANIQIEKLQGIALDQLNSNKPLSLSNLESIIDDMGSGLDNISITGSSKSTKVVALNKAKALNNIKASVGRFKQKINDNNLEYNQKQTLKNLGNTLTLGTYESFQKNFNESIDLIPDNEALNAVKNITEDKFNEIQNILGNVLESDKSSLEVFKEILGGNQLSTKGKIFGLTRVEIFDLFKPVSLFAIEEINSAISTSGTATKESISIAKIHSSLLSDKPNNVVSATTTSSEGDKYIEQIISNGVQPDDIPIIKKFIERGFKSKNIGNIFKVSLREGDENLLNSFTLPLLKLIKDENINISNLNISNETYGLLKSFADINPNDRTEIIQRFKNTSNDIEDTTIKNNYGNIYQKFTKKATVEGFVNKSNSQVFDDVKQIIFNTMLDGTDDIKKPKLAEAVSKFIHFQTYKELLNTGFTDDLDRGDIKKEVNRILDQITIGDVSYKKLNDSGVTNLQNDFTYRNNSFQNKEGKFIDLAIGNPYQELQKKSELFAEYFPSDNFHSQSILTFLNVTDQIKKKNGTLNFELNAEKNKNSWEQKIKNSNAPSFKGDSLLFSSTEVKKTITATELNKAKQSLSFQGIPGDIIGNQFNDNNLIDALTVDGMPFTPDRVKFIASESLSENERYVQYTTRIDGIDNKQLITDDNNELITITIPENHTDKLTNLNNKYGYALKKRYDTVSPSSELASPIAQKIQPLPNAVKNLKKIDTFTNLNESEKRLLNYNRSFYTLNINNADTNINTDFTDTIIENNNKFYVVPSRQIQELPNNIFKSVMVDGKSKFEYFVNTGFISEYDTKVEAEQAIDKLEIIYNQDKKLIQ